VWLKIDDAGFNTKVVDGTLWVRAQSAMLGYLNAPNPFDDEGWINTQDAVEVDGEYIRILGRKSDLINVGGQKVYPAEVENSLLQLDNVADVMVFGALNPIMGQVVAARFRLNQPEDFVSFKRRVRDWCKGALASYKVPVSIEISEADLVTNRHKKQRRAANG
jgi:acyl-CoA synthetase (AMP-forming)/AMP-acid ligase II